MIATPASTALKKWSTPTTCAISGLPTRRRHAGGVDAGNRTEVPDHAQEEAAEVAQGGSSTPYAQPLVGPACEDHFDGGRAPEHRRGLRGADGRPPSRAA